MLTAVHLRGLLRVKFVAGNGEEHVVKRRRANVEPGDRHALVAKRNQQVCPVLACGFGGDADSLLAFTDYCVAKWLELLGNCQCLPAFGLPVFQFDIEDFAADTPFQFGWTAVSDDVAVKDDRQSVTELVGFFEILCREENRGAAVVDPPKILPQTVASLRVESGRGFVEKDQRRPVNQCRRRVQTFFHPTGELLGPLFGDIRKVDQVE